MAKFNSQGTVRLPFKVLFAVDALGASFAGSVDNAAFTLQVPPQSNGDESAIELAEPPGGPWWGSELLDQGWGYVGSQNSVDMAPLAFWVAGLAIKVEADSNGEREPFEVANMLGSRFDDWYTEWLEWVSAWSGQPIFLDTNLGIRTQAHLEVNDQPGDRSYTGWSGPLRARAVSSKHAVTLAMVRGAARRVSASERLPLAWRLWDTALLLRDRRRALIDAASAAEIALAGALRARLAGLPAGAQESIINSANGLVGLVKLLEQIDGGTKQWKAVADRLGNPRNMCVHRGADPTEAALSTALETARSILEIYDPLPEIGDTLDPSLSSR